MPPMLDNLVDLSESQDRQCHEILRYSQTCQSGCKHNLIAHIPFDHSVAIMTPGWAETSSDARFNTKALISKQYFSQAKRTASREELSYIV